MATLNAITGLYENVLNYELAISDVSLSEIKLGIQSMAYVYAPLTSNFQSNETKFTNFNDPACRCAYLHKYAPLHTYIVQDNMMKILREIPEHFRKLLLNNSQLKICSLGGGPGSDVIGVLTALFSVFGTFQSSITIIDCMKHWEDTFTLIMHELNVRPFRNGNFDRIWSDNNNCQWNYIECNLLQSMTNEVNESIHSASMITMVKFLSAAICLETENMVDRIFEVVKPGALVLFIDNAAGGFSQIVERAGKRNGLHPIFGPLRHVEYEAEALKIERFGYTSCFKTKVTIILLQKGLNSKKNRRNLNSVPQMSGQNAVSNAKNLSTKGASSLQKPKSAATGQTKLNVTNSARPDNRLFDRSLSKTPLTNSGFRFEQPSVVVPPKSPTRNYPTPNRRPRPDNRHSAVRNYQPAPGDSSRRDQPPIDADIEPICCSCCSIS